jgi:cytochrome P450
MKAVLGENSLVVIGGEYWRRMRKLFNPAFSPSHLETMISSIVEESMVFVERLKEVSNTGTVVKMNEMTMVFSPFLNIYISI